MIRQRQRADDHQVMRAAGMEGFATKEEKESDWWPTVHFEGDLRNFYAGIEDDGFDPRGGPVETEVVSMAEFATRMRARQQKVAEAAEDEPDAGEGED